MLRDAWSITVPTNTGGEIIVVKLHKGTVAGRWNAQRVINAVRKKLPLEKIALDVVVIDGDPIEQPNVIGSSPDAETFIRRMTPQLAGYRWQLTKLDW
jgi:hypothetical protein